MKSIKMFGKSVPLIAIVLVCMLTVGASAYLATYLSETVTSDVTVTSPMVARILISGREDWATAQRWRPGYWRGDNTWAEGAMVDAFPEGLDGDPDDTEDPGVLVGLGTGGWEESDWTTTGTVEIMGGETITLYLMSANLANAEINAHEEFRIYNSVEISSDDFVSISIRYDSIYGDIGYGKLYADATDWYLEPEEGYPWTSDDGKGIEMLLPDDISTWGVGETDVAQLQIAFDDAARGTYTFSYRITPAVPTP